MENFADVHTAIMINVLCLHLAPHRPSYRYRIEQFLPHWTQYDIRVETLCVSGKRALNHLLEALRTSWKYDYVWIQRKVFPTSIIRLLARRSRIIFDFDDAIYVKQVMLTGTEQPESRLKLGWLAGTLSGSALVFAGSTTLQTYAKRYNQNVHLVPTALNAPGQQIPEQRQNGTVTIGWIGVNSNLYFLNMIDKALSELQTKQPGVRFSLMSGKLPQEVETNWELSPWSSEDEVQWLEQIDIGIMPLSDDEWCRGKCAFKLIQYMAYGKPVVASNVGANKAAITEGVNGFLVNSEQEWIESLDRLVSDKALRQRMGVESRRIHMETYERAQVQAQIAALIHEDHRTASPPNAAR